MKKFGLDLNFDAIRKRIEEDKNLYKPGVWAKMLGVSNGVVSNVHGKTKQNPSLEYIIAAAKATGRSIDYYVWGNEKGGSIATYTDPVVIEHQNLVKKFKNPERGLRINQGLVEIEKLSEKVIREMELYIKASLNTTRAILGRGGSEYYPEPNMENLERELDPERYKRELSQGNLNPQEGGEKKGKTGTEDK